MAITHVRRAIPTSIRYDGWELIASTLLDDCGFAKTLICKWLSLSNCLSTSLTYKRSLQERRFKQKYCGLNIERIYKETSWTSLQRADTASPYLLLLRGVTLI
jgi:hypothetical protein